MNAPHPAAAAREPELETIIAAHVAGLRGACSREMRDVMNATRGDGNVSDSAAASWVYSLAEMVMSCNRLEERIQERVQARRVADSAGEVAGVER